MEFNFGLSELFPPASALEGSVSGFDFVRIGNDMLPLIPYNASDASDASKVLFQRDRLPLIQQRISEVYH